MANYRQKDKYLRLLTLFEENLKSYHPIFTMGNYELRYNICDYQFNDKFEISVEMITRLTSASFILRLKNENVYKLFASYCNYFSINQFNIVKPYDSNHRIDRVNYKPTSINQRITLSNNRSRVISSIFY